MLLVAVALSAGCSSTPLPPWPAKSTRQATTTNQPAKSNQESKNTSAAITSPVGVPPTLGGTTPSTSIAPRTITNKAVAARFLEPSVRYQTPGLAPERRAFTTNAELTQWLNQITTVRGTTRAHLQEIGRSQRGLPIHALLLTQARGSNIAAVEASGRPTILLVGQQYGDAPASSEALLVLARELTTGGLLESLLAHINVIIVPRANPDAAEANQRLSANHSHMAHDHLLLRTPEAQALARLVRDWRPLTVVDAHEYPVDGAALQPWRVLARHDVLLQYAATAGVPEFITKAAQEWYYPAIANALAQAGFSYEWYYDTSLAAGQQRITSGSTLADMLHNISSLKNAISLRISTRGAGLERAHIQRRVHAQVMALSSILRTTAERSSQLEQVRTFVARDTASQTCMGEVVLHAVATPASRDLLVLDPRNGADKTLRVQWESTQQLSALKTRTRPCGYWLSANATAAVERLKLLGLQVLRVAEAGSAQIESHAQTTRSMIPLNTTNSRGQTSLQRSTAQVPAGSYFVPLRQPWAHLAVAALELEAPGNYFTQSIIASQNDGARVTSPPALVFEEEPDD